MAGEDGAIGKDSAMECCMSALVCVMKVKVSGYLLLEFQLLRIACEEQPTGEGSRFALCMICVVSMSGYSVMMYIPTHPPE